MPVDRNVPGKVKRIVAFKQSWTCNYCVRVLPPTYQIDHVVPLHHGGDNTIDNLQALCVECHATKTYTETLHLKRPLPDWDELRNPQRPKPPPPSPVSPKPPPPPPPSPDSPKPPHNVSPNSDIKASKRFKCRCGKALDAKWNLQRHENKCNGLSKKQCPTCHKWFETRKGKYQHIKHVRCQPVTPTTTTEAPVIPTTTEAPVLPEPPQITEAPAPPEPPQAIPTIGPLQLLEALSTIAPGITVADALRQLQSTTLQPCASAPSRVEGQT